MKTSALHLSQHFLLRVKKGEHYEGEVNVLRKMPLEQLLGQITTNERKLVFWINIYNAFSMAFLKAQPALIGNLKMRNTHFSEAKITIASQQFSLNDIEHGILSKSMIWWSKGYLQKWFPSHLERQLRVDKRDARVHFALNCGGKSCPPIRFYQVENLEAQLKLATAAFLESETTYDAAKNEVKTSRIIDWFIGDFGGKKGFLQLLKTYDIIPADIQPRLSFHRYDWTLDTDVFVD